MTQSSPLPSVHPSLAHTKQLLHNLFRALTSSKPKIAPLIEEIHIGSVLSPLGGTKVGRMSALHSSLAVSAGFSHCQQSLCEWVTTYSGHSRGCDSVTRFYGNKAVPWEIWPELLTSNTQGARHEVTPMGITRENVASRYAQQRGNFKNEIIPVTCEYALPTGKGKDALPEKQQITVTKDDGVRPDTTVEILASLPPAFSPTGSATAGNSSQISHGAVAMLIMSRARVEALDLKPLCRFVASAVVGCAPDEIGIGPALAIPKLLEYLGIQREQVDVWEVNEAFASQAIYCHPLGAIGARLVVGYWGRGTGIGCIGGGQGMAAMFVGE
ncbi:Thiolase, N-terminal domain-containing protein [Terfezia claveryi]|nr:Thiolase, N-terminal domain-containing protein [Terfezia claveryi]